MVRSETYWTTITDCNGAVEQELSYDAWGNLRDPETWCVDASITPLFDRGYTGHEHLSGFGLINMNGRMYDPVMSSFLSVDRYVQQPETSQGFNRYAYCMYNPLKYVDPSGWQKVGGMKPRNAFHDDWSNSHVQPVYEPSDFHNAYYLVNQALYGEEIAGGCGYGAAFQAGMEFYLGASPGSVWSLSHLINNYTNNPSTLNRRDLMKAGITDYTYSTWWSAEGMGGYQYSVSFNHGTYNYGDDNYNFGYKGFSDITVGGMDLSKTTSKLGFLSALSFINSVSSTIIGNNASYYNTPERYKELGASLRPKLKKVGHPMRKASTRMIGERFASNFGKLNTFLGSAGVALSLYDIYKQGEINYSNGFNLVMTGVCAFCPGGWVVGSVWIVSDIISLSYTGKTISGLIERWEENY